MTFREETLADGIRLICGDCREVLKELPAASVDACVTDPPYGLQFMGKGWDHGVPSIPYWREVFRVLKPGAFLLAFGGTRTYHRLACAIEDAGFEIRDSINYLHAAGPVLWVYGSGFPKSLNVSKQLNKYRCMCGVRDSAPVQASVSARSVLQPEMCGDGQAEAANGENLRDLRQGVGAGESLSSGTEQNLFAGMPCGEDFEVQQGQSEGGQDSVRSLRQANLSGTDASQAEPQGLLQPQLSRESPRPASPSVLCEWEGQTSAGNGSIPRQEPGLEGRRNVSPSPRELCERQIREVPESLCVDGAGGRIRNGASAGNGANAGPSVASDGMRSPSRSQASEQQSHESGTLARQPQPQKRGAWDHCRRCGKPIVPDGLGTALKPACEPIVLARKPLIGTVAENVLAHGTGAINVDGCRVATDELKSGTYKRNDQHSIYNGDTSGLTKSLDYDGSKGRWPANLIHDGSAEVVEAFPAEAGGGTGTRGAASGVHNYGFDGHKQVVGHGDSGSAARFFYAIKKDVLCGLCFLPLRASSTTLFECDVPIAELSSPTENIRIESSAHSDVRDLRSHASADRPRQSNGHVSNAANHFSECHRPKRVSVPPNAELWPLEKIVQNVRSAADLCDLCATDIAQRLAAVRRKEREGLSPSKCSIDGFRETILSRSLASYVENRENTDTILTTTNLRELFGCVFHAIGEHISSARSEVSENTKPVAKRLWYSSKADVDDRLGSKHPTVKPLDLMQYLVRLVTPKGGVVLDCFAGTGTTGEAAFREGMRAVLIEREPEYQSDIRRRMSLVLGGQDERRHAAIKASGKVEEDPGPLFNSLATRS